jgi:peptide deformylase
VKTILRFPNHRLRATAQRVVVFDEDLCSLATGLLETLRGASAIGITATHIGVLKRLAVIEPGRRLRCANSVSMRAGVESWRLASA